MGLKSNGRLLILARKYWTKVEVNDIDKHFNMSQYNHNYGPKRFNSTGSCSPYDNPMKLLGVIKTFFQRNLQQFGPKLCQCLA
jgi:hypothetical protein